MDYALHSMIFCFWSSKNAVNVPTFAAQGAVRRHIVDETCQAHVLAQHLQDRILLSLNRGEWSS
jgi:hypothetical protein